MELSSVKMEFDSLKLYFGGDYEIGKIRISQPTIGQLMDYGERAYYSMIHSLTSIPSDAKSLLWDAGIDYCAISDFEYFIFMTRGLKQEATKIILNDLDLSRMQMFKKDGNLVLYDSDTDIVIDEFVYTEMASYIRAMHNIVVKPEKTKSKMIRDILIADDRGKRERHANDTYHSAMLPMISACLNSPGFKYKKSELKDCGIFEFFDSVSRLQILNTAQAVMNGMYCGFADYSKSPGIKEQANIFRDLTKK